MQALTLTILIVCYTVYLLIGGAVFMALESSTEETTKTNSLATYRDFLTAKACITNDELENFVRAIISAHQQGVIATHNTTSESQWTYGNAIFFSMTAVTTIGYGNQTPTTTGGRVFLVVYALVGIPMCALMLAVVGDKLSKLAKSFTAKECSKKHKKVERVFKALTVPLIGILIFIIVPSVIFTAIEDWTFGESLYYSFVTLTTIGFGDFVIGTHMEGSVRIVYRLLSGVWIVLGLAWLATVITQATMAYQRHMDKVDMKVNRYDEIKGRGEKMKIVPTRINVIREKKDPKEDL